MTFKLVSSANGWKALSTTLAQFRPEVSFIIKPEGLSFVTIDASRNQFIIMDWNKDKFKAYDIQESTRITFYSQMMEKIFKRFSYDDEIIIEEQNKNTITFTKVGSNTSYELKRLNPTDDDGFSDKLPDPGHQDKRFEIQIKDIETMIGDSEVFNAEEVWLENIDGKLVFSGLGESGTTTGMLVEKFDEEIKGTGYSFEYIKPFINGIKPFAEPAVQAGIGNRKPLLLELEIKDAGTLKYILGPRMVQENQK